MVTVPPDRGFAAPLYHPLPLFAALVLAVNDHLLKDAGRVPGWLTGKLSDVAGLFFFPLLLLALAEIPFRLAGRPLPHARWVGVACIVVTALGFAAVKLAPSVNGAIEGTWGVNSMDRADLLALPILLATLIHLERHV